MATSQSQTFRGGSVAPGQGIHEDDIHSLVINRKTESNISQQKIYDPLQGNAFNFGRITFKRDGNSIGSYDPFDSDKDLVINESVEVVAGDTSISVQKTVDHDTDAETFAVSVADEGITNDKIADATIEPEKLAKKKQITVDGVTIIATPISDDEVQLSANIPTIPEALVIPDGTVLYDGQTATVSVPCENGKIYSLDFDASSLSSVTLDLEIDAGEPVNGPTKHCYVRVRNNNSACNSYTITYSAPDGGSYSITETIDPGDKSVYDVLARKSSAGTLVIINRIGLA